MRPSTLSSSRHGARSSLGLLVPCARRPCVAVRVLAGVAQRGSRASLLSGCRGLLPKSGGRATLRSRGTLKVQALFEKFTERSIKAVMIAQQEAKLLGASEVNTEHMLLGLITEDSLSKNGYLNSGMTLEKAKAAVDALAGKRRPATTETIVFSRSVRRMFEAATNECKRSGVSYISPEHILLALLSMQDTEAKKVLDSLSIECDVLKNESVKRIKGEIEAESPKKKKANEKDAPKMLKEYCKDLNECVKAGRIDPVIGRDREVTRVTQILARRSKNNPILLGEPGVGKTAIAEGLALAIVNRMNPDGSPLPAFLWDKRVMQLDVGLVIAGAKERGELEQRMTKLIAEIKADGNVILMIDEVHMLVGAGSSGKGGGGGLDIANLVKPALARGEFQVIGATTLDEFRKYIERDAALERRFQPVHVNEPTEEETLEILRGLREKYERHHKCVYTEGALEAAVKLSSKYIADRFMPDKAIDLLDEAGSRVRITAYNARRDSAQRESPKVHEYLQVMETMTEAVKDGLYEEAVILHRRQSDYKAELAGPATSGSSLPVVDTCDIEHIVASWTGIPVESMGEDEKERLVKLSSVLKEHVIGQDEAVDTLASALMRARCGLNDPNRPVASLLFVGPTGVGKTELAKVLAEQYYGSEDAMIRLDMSEYMERHSVSKLIGAPPGYVGFSDGGKLTEAVRRRPCCLVLLDEVEKAHPDVFNILLQILEDGRLTDSKGRTVSFKNALIVLTSNIGSRLIAGTGGGLGAFSRSLDAEDEVVAEPAAASAAAWQRQQQAQAQAQPADAYRNGRLRDLVLDEIKQHFRPELLNRMDEQVVFQKLGRAEVKTIAGLMIQDTITRVRERGYSLQLSQRMVDRIMLEGYSDEYGVRPLRQTVVRYIDDNLSDAILRDSIPTGSTLSMDLHPETGDVHIRHSLQESITVTGHASGFNGEITIFQDAAPLTGGDSPVAADQVIYLTQE